MVYVCPLFENKLALFSSFDIDIWNQDLRYFSALYLEGSLLSLSLSMLSSIFGIANSFYISRHLAVQEYDDVDDEMMMKNGPAVCVVGAGEARLPPPPGLKLPAPPGLNPIIPASSNGRKPGQFASATE